MKNTSCSKCIFSKKSISDHPCELGIIDAIKDTKNISVKNEYNYIENYECQYALDAKFYEEHLSNQIDNKDLKEHIFYNRTIRYWLVINCNDMDKIPNICDVVNSYDIIPRKISFFMHSLESDKLQQATEIIQDKIKTTKWTVHNILDEDKLENVLYATVSLIKSNENINHFLVVEDSTISAGELDSSSIHLLNHICYILQPEDCNALQQQNKNSIDTLFMSIGTYKSLTKLHSQSIEYCIENLPDFIMCNYD